VSNALQDVQISEVEFKTVLDEMEKYNNLKQEIRQAKNSKNKRSRKKALIEQGRTEAMNLIQNKMKSFVIYCFTNVYKFEKKPLYQ
jgi:ATP-dependent protease HslVU (ClpYQ) peptidase subunit